MRSSYSPLGKIDICLLADDVGVSSSYTLDLGQGVHDLALSVNVGVEQTEDVVEDLYMQSLLAVYSLEALPVCRKDGWMGIGLALNRRASHGQAAFQYHSLEVDLCF
jgi:hypothetical protein